MIPRRAQRRDANEAAIVEALTKAGAVVYRISEPCDLVVGYRRRLVMLEIKQPKGRLTEAQQQLLADAHLHGFPVAVVHDVDEALAAIGVRK